MSRVDESGENVGARDIRILCKNFASFSLVQPKSGKSEKVDTVLTCIQRKYSPRM
jgi:hypothetical protein